MAQDFFSTHAIDDVIEFHPTAQQAKELCIVREPRNGTVVAVRFTKPKVFYDILDEYYGIVFRNVDSSYVFSTQPINSENVPTCLNQE